MSERAYEVVVVTSFGDGAEHYRSLIGPGVDRGGDVDLTVARTHDDLRDRLAARGDAMLAVVVDRWLRDDAAGACLDAAAAAGVDAWLMVLPGGLATSRDEVGTSAPFQCIEKPLTRDSLERIVSDVLGRRTATGAERSHPEAAEAPPRIEPASIDTASITGEAIETGPPASPPITGMEAGAARLLDEVRETLRKLSDVIQYDSLSGLLHRDFFLERAVHEERQARRYGLPIGALMIDVDDFKAINDTHGHDAGNAVLAAIGDAIRRTVRDDLDIGSRLYGDEFAILLPATPLRGAVRVGERLQETIAEIDDPCPFSISVGCHALEPEQLDDAAIRTLLEAADQALLVAKRRGKSQVASLDPLDDESAPRDDAPVAAPGSPTTEPPASTAPRSEPIVSEAPAAGDTGESVDAAEDPIAVALADAVGGLAEDAELAAFGAIGRVLLVNADREVGQIVVDFLFDRGMRVDVVPDLATALTELDSLEYFLVLVDGHPAQPEVRAFLEAVRRIDPALFAFLLADRNAASEHGDDGSSVERVQVIGKPFLLSELYVRASRVRDAYHLDRETGQAGEDRAGGSADESPEGATGRSNGAEGSNRQG